MNIIHEDSDFVVVNKPAGVLTHRTSHSFEPALADEAVEGYPEMAGVGDLPELRPGVVHRLDKDTSGVVVFARNQKFFEYLKGCFKEGKVKKTYLALVWGRTPDRGTIDAPIGLKSGSTRRSVLPPSQGYGRAGARNMKMVKPARTEYQTERHFSYEGEEFSLVKLFPKTGRTHQLRVHLLHIHHPVVGDPLYGKRKNPFGLARQFLHADTIEFPIPGGKRASFGADLPTDLEAVLKVLVPYPSRKGEGLTK